jgi:hypothetical protein
MGAIAATVLASLQLDAAADPITYDGTLPFGGGTLPGAIGVGDNNDARLADYWRFWATAGDSVTVLVERVDTALDPSQWIFSGLYGDTGDALLTAGDHFFGVGETATFIDYADDEMSDPGPFGDPLSIFTAPVTGWYTVAVSEFLSGALPTDDGDYDYEITVRGITGRPVPEPTLLVLLACGACGVTLSRRRKSA